MCLFSARTDGRSIWCSPRVQYAAVWPLTSSFSQQSFRYLIHFAQAKFLLLEDACSLDLQSVPSIRNHSQGSFMRLRSSLGFLLLFISASLMAQTFRGTILGTVTDPQGAVIPGAKVTVHNV